MLKGVLLFLAGLLVGANLVYFLMSRDHEAPTTAAVPLERAFDPSAPEHAVPKATPAPPAPTASTPPAPATPVPTPSATPPTTALQMPVVGIRPEQLANTYNDTRGGIRNHEALDIMAPRGTPVVAAIDGKVAKLFTSDAGGLTVYQFDPTETYAYYYAHLDSYAPGLQEGQQLRRGDPIGTVGSTGNASPDAPHLHFAIFLLGPEKQWWKGTPVNPYPLLFRR